MSKVIIVLPSCLKKAFDSYFKWKANESSSSNHGIKYIEGVGTLEEFSYPIKNNQAVIIGDQQVVTQIVNEMIETIIECFQTEGEAKEQMDSYNYYKKQLMLLQASLIEKAVDIIIIGERKA